MLELISPELAALINRLFDFFIHIVIEGGYLTVFLTMTLESACIPIPSEVVMPFSGYMVYLGKLNLLLVGLIASLANVTGSLIAYHIGLYAGRPLILRYGKYVLLHEHHLSLSETFFKKYGQWSILAGRCLPLIRTFISLPAGFGKMPIIRFIIFTFAGSLPWNYALTWAGYALGENWEKILGITEYIDIIIVILFLALIGWLIYRALHKNKASSSS